MVSYYYGKIVLDSYIIFFSSSWTLKYRVNKMKVHNCIQGMLFENIFSIREFAHCKQFFFKWRQCRLINAYSRLKSFIPFSRGLVVKFSLFGAFQESKQNISISMCPTTLYPLGCGDANDLFHLYLSPSIHFVCPFPQNLLFSEPIFQCFNIKKISPISKHQLK